MNITDVILEHLAPNLTRIKVGETIIYFSYSQPVVIQRRRMAYLRKTWDGRQWSSTTLHHLSAITKFHLPAGITLRRIKEEEFLKMRL